MTSTLIPARQVTLQPVTDPSGAIRALAEGRAAVEAAPDLATAVENLAAVDTLQKAVGVFTESAHLVTEAQRLLARALRKVGLLGYSDGVWAGGAEHLSPNHTANARTFAEISDQEFETVLTTIDESTSPHKAARQMRKARSEDAGFKSSLRYARRQGQTWSEIADKVGLSTSMVRRIADPAYVEGARRRKADLKTGQQQREREQRARERGGNVATAYSLLRKLQLELDAAAASSQSDVELTQLRGAYRASVVVEEYIDLAIRGSLDKPKGYHYYG